MANGEFDPCENIVQFCLSPTANIAIREYSRLINQIGNLKFITVTISVSQLLNHPDHSIMETENIIVLLFNSWDILGNVYR